VPRRAREGAGRGAKSRNPGVKRGDAFASTRAISRSRDRTRSLRAAAIWERAHPYRHVHRQHRAAPRHGRRTAGQGSGRDCAGGLHHAEQWRLDHVRHIPELTASGIGDHRLARSLSGACLKSSRRDSLAGHRHRTREFKSAARSASRSLVLSRPNRVVPHSEPTKSMRVAVVSRSA
jgi:hypothetical protein